jgi:hypothetical protein
MERSEPIPEEVKAGDIERAGRRFAADMRAQREAQGIPLSTIHQETRISEGVLEEFEETGLATNQVFNRVYLRSLVISYSKIVGLNPRDSLSALEAALEGTYESGLLIAKEGESKSDGDVESEAGERDHHAEIVAEDPANGRAAAEGAAGGLENEEPGLYSAENESADASGADTRSHRLASRFEFISSIEQERAEGGVTIARKSTRPRLKTEISTAIHDFRPPESQKGLIVAPTRFRSLALGSLVVIVSVSAIFLAIKLSNRLDADEASGGTPSSDFISRQEVAVLPPDPIPPAPVVNIGDTITVTLIAEKGPLDPVRVQLDSDLRRPFWVEAGDSISFRMGRRIAIEDLLARLTVKVEGLPYPIGSYADPERFVITRDSVEAFVESRASR